MATITIDPQKYRYFRRFPPDATFIKNYLIPGLAKQGNYSGASKGIKLPHGENETAQYLPLSEASQIIIDYLTEHNYLRQREGERLSGFINSKRFTDLANTFQLIIRERITDPNKLLTSRLTQNIIAHQDSLKAKPETPDTDHLQDLRKYQTLKRRIVELAQSGKTGDQIKDLLPKNITSIDSNLNHAAFTSFIISQLPETLSLANQYSNNPAQAERAIINHLKRSIDSSHPELSNLPNYLHANESKVFELVTNLGGKFGKTDIKDLAVTREKAVQSLSYVLPAHHALTEKLTQALSDYRPDEQARVISTLITTINSSTSSPLTSDQILTRVISELKLPSGALTQLKTTIRTAGLDTALEFHQHQTFLDYTSRRLTPAERALFKRGINPNHTALSLTQLRDKAQLLLPPQPLHVDDAQVALEIQKQLDREQNYLTHQSLDNWLNNFQTISDLEGNRRLNWLVNRSRSERRFFELPIAEKWYEIEDVVTGRRFMRNIFDKYDKFAESKAILTIKRKGKDDLRIPLLRLMPWALDSWDNFKKVTTNRWLLKLANVESLHGRFTKFWLDHYVKGDLTVGGMFNSGWGEIWSKRIIRPITKWTGAKYTTYLAKEGAYGMLKGNVFKYFGGGTAKGIGRTATRFLLKIGAKSIANGTGKAIAALITATTGIGTFISGILLVGLVIDIAKLGFNFVKEFLRNADFRKKILRVASIVTGTLAVFKLAPIGLFLGAIGLLMLQTILLSAAVALGLLAFFMIFFNIFTKLPWDIDSAPGNLNLLNLVCDKTGQGDNPTINVAVCIAQILSDANLNPLTKSGVLSGLWQSIIAALSSFGGAAERLHYSANQYLTLQCSGLNSAIDVALGGSGHFSDANLLDTIEPPGYHFSPGVGSCSPGDFFVDKNGKWGHTGVYVSDGGPYIQCVDANSDGKGLVRGPDSCVWEKSKIAGCLKKL